ncbi:MAG: chromate efflux transporter [Pseudomonadota bacterium]
MGELNGSKRPGTAREVFGAFLPLGLTAFGGPVAHLGFFRTAFVEQRRWLSDSAYADLVALCQFLPGPASSQVGMAIGLQRAGGLGLIAAWAAFTLPSALAMAAFGILLGTFGVLADAPWILGLKAAAVAVVAQALLGMASSLAGTRERATIAAIAAIAILLAPDRTVAQLAVIILGGFAGLALSDVDAPDKGAPTARTIPRPVGAAALALFFVLLAGLPLLAGFGPALDLFDRIYRAGALVFGGGHVVLPLLQSEMGSMVGEAQFLAGYGAAQAVPGPLFTFAAYLGAVSQPFGGVAGASIALIAIFLPGALLVVGVLPFWEGVRKMALARRILAGVNAAVVGLLVAAFYDPVFTMGVPSAAALALAIASFIALRQWHAPPWAVVVACGLIGWIAL